MPDSWRIQTSGCPICGGNKKLSLKDFVEKSREMHGDKYDYSMVKYINNHTLVKIMCPTHGEFEQLPSSHMKGNNCPYCNESAMEEEIKIFLQKNNISYERQKKYESIKYKKELPFDFYLSQYNAIIECQGEQHFKEKHFFDDKERFIKDKLKHEGCLKEQIKILYYTNVKHYEQYFGKLVYNENNLFNDKNKLLEEIKKVG